MTSNFRLLGGALARLGGVPPMLTAEDCCGGRSPDEKVVIGFLAHLCSRLLEVSAEERAAHTLQRIWHRRKACRPGAPPSLYSQAPSQMMGEVGLEGLMLWSHPPVLLFLRFPSREFEPLLTVLLRGLSALVAFKNLLSGLP